MSKNLKIATISALIVLVIVSLVLFFVFRKTDKKQTTGKEWTSLDKEIADDFIANNFTSELASEIDLESFLLYGDLDKQYHNSNFRILYAKDKNGLYMRFFCNDIASFVQIEGADEESFEILDNCYSKDKNRAYFSNVVISDADSKTFIVLDKNYSKDNVNIYFQQYTIVGADIASFEIISNNEKEGYYSKDNEHLFQRHLIVSNLTPDNFTTEKTDDIKKGLFDCLNNEIDKDSFEVIDDNYAKDKNNVYIFVRGEGGLNHCYKIAQADPESFEVVFNFWAKDSDSTFFEDEEIDVDPDTFEVINDNYAKDDDNVYYQDTTVPDADPDTFEPEEEVLEDETVATTTEEDASEDDPEEEEEDIPEEIEDIFDDEDNDDEDNDDDQEEQNDPEQEGTVVDYDIDIFTETPEDDAENCYWKKADNGPYVERHCETD